METIVEKLARKFPNSEIKIRDGEIFLHNPSTGKEKFVGKMASEIPEFSQDKNPLYSSSSWVNVDNYGIKSFSSFGRIPKKKCLSGTELGRYFQKKINETFLEEEKAENNLIIRKHRNETIIRNIQDTGNYRGEFLNTTDLEIQRKKRCRQILLSMKENEEKIIKFRK